MRKIKFITRILLCIGTIMSVVPSIFIYFQDKPEWLDEAIYQSSAWTIFSIAAMAVITELHYLFFKNIYIAATLLSSTFAVILTACIYINGATFFGAETANVNNWHLLPLFTAFHQIKVTAFVTCITGAICILLICSKALARRLA